VLNKPLFYTEMMYFHVRRAVECRIRNRRCTSEVHLRFRHRSSTYLLFGVIVILEHLLASIHVGTEMTYFHELGAG